MTTGCKLAFIKEARRKDMESVGVFGKMEPFLNVFALMIGSMDLGGLFSAMAGTISA